MDTAAYQMFVSQLESFAEAGSCCTHCQSSRVAKHGFAHGSQRFRCGECHKTFSILTGTPFHHM